MHESDAMNFIEPVLLGFLSRSFDYEEGENPELYEVHLKRIRDFIQDKEPYWVKEKALFIIDMIEWAESEIKEGRYKPSSPENMVTAALRKTKERIGARTAYYKGDKPQGKTLVSLTLPSFPKE
jgi:hypothetical protein